MAEIFAFIVCDTERFCQHYIHKNNKKNVFYLQAIKQHKIGNIGYKKE